MRFARVWCAFVLLVVGLALVTPDVAPAAAADADPHVLLIAGNTRPPAGDVAIAELVVDLGYDLTIVDDDADLAALDLSDVAAVLISTSVTPSKVGDLFDTTPVPLVVWEAHLFDDLRMADGLESTFAHTSIEISDPDHPIAAGRSGMVEVTSLPRQLTVGRGIRADNEIAHVPGSDNLPVVFAYDALDELSSSWDPAPGPRVGLFASYDGSRRLTSDGLALYAAAIEWAVEAPTVAPATNDDFADRDVLVDRATSQSLTAGLEPGEDQPFFREDWSLWWTWTADAAGTVTMTSDSSGIAVWRGEDLGALDLVGWDDTGASPSVSVDVEAGDTLQVSVADADYDRGPVEVTAQLDTNPRPVNDDRADRLVLDETAIGTNVGATLEPDERLPGYRERSSVWWSWTAPSDGLATISTAGSDFDTVLAVWPADSPLRNVIATDDGGGASTSTVRFAVEAGTTYDVAVYGHREAQGGIVLGATVDTPAPPANDDFADLAVIIDEAATGSNLGATTEPDESTPGYWSEAEASVWFSWTAPRSGTYTVSTRGSAFDSVAAVWRGDALDSLTLASTADSTQDVRGPLFTEERFDAVGGVTYPIAVYSVRGTRGDIELSLTLDDVPAPDNDDFADRLPLVDVATGTNVGATTEPGEQEPPSKAGATGSVWWTWTAPSDGTVSISTDGTLFDTVVAVWTGDRVDALDLVVANDDAPWVDSEQSRAVFEAEAGTTYQVSVYGSERWRGDIQLDVVDAPANDDFADRLLLETSTTGSNIGATLEPGEPVTYLDATGSVWWTWTAPQTDTVRFSTAGGSLAGSVTIWTGDTLATLEEIAFGDSFGNGPDAAVDVDVVAGTTYQVSVAGFQGGEGTIHLSVRPSDAPRRAVMVAGSTRPPSGDQAIADLVRAAGFDLTFVDDDTDLAALDLDGVDLLLVSTSVVPGKVGDALADVDVPLITWEGHLFDDLGLASTSGETPATTRRIEVVESDHPLAAGLSGTAAVYESAHRLSHGRPGSNAVVIAREIGRPNRIVVFGYEAGWGLADGNVVNGRRVALFADYRGAGDLGPAGEALVTAALDWAT